MAWLWGAPTSAVALKSALCYRPLSMIERDRVIMESLETAPPEVGPQRAANWESCWRKRLEVFRASRDEQDLLPDYYRHVDGPLRLGGEWVKPLTPGFFHTYMLAFRQWLFGHFAGCAEVHEFGCGSGWNLLLLRKMFPEVRLRGMDWSPACAEILRLLEIPAVGFNLYRDDVALPPDTGVLTFTALEQVGAGLHWLQSVLKAKPRIAINVEPLYELYNPKSLMDYLAMRYHERRGYLRGYLPFLQSLEVAGGIDILACHKHQFAGNIFNDSFSYVIWRPRGDAACD